MSRPIKSGLSYFPLDVWFFEGRKIRRLMKAMGNESALIYLSVLCDIYKERGYYLLYSDDYCFDLSMTFNLPEKTIRQIILYCAKIDLFDARLFSTNSALTSAGIQARYKEICKRSKSKMQKTLLLDDNESTHPSQGVSAAETIVSVTETNVFAAKTGVSATKTPSKEKKTKQKKTEEKKKDNVSVSDETIFDSFCEWAVAYFNTVFLGKMPPIKKLTVKRRKAIRACTLSCGQSSVKSMIDMAVNCPFLLGENERGWTAGFDWLFTPDNFVKVIEGTYLKKQKHEENKPTDAQSAQRKAEILRMAAEAIDSDRDTRALR